jgi:hypothetical protein
MIKRKCCRERGDRKEVKGSKGRTFCMENEEVHIIAEEAAVLLCVHPHGDVEHDLEPLQVRRVAQGTGQRVRTSTPFHSV